MAETESNQRGVFGEPSGDFPSECDRPVGTGDAPKTRRVLQGGQVVLITLTSAAGAENEFLSEREALGGQAGPILQIVPVERVRDHSLTDTLTGSSSEARAGAPSAWVSTAFATSQAVFANYQETSPIRRISIGLAVAVLGGVVYAALPGHLPGVSQGAASRTVEGPVISREAATTPAQDAAASHGPASDPFHADANSREASELTRLNSDLAPRLLAGAVSARPEESVTTGGERRPAVTEDLDRQPTEQPQELLVSQLRSARDTPVVVGTLLAPSAAPEPADDAVKPTDVVGATTTSLPKATELVGARAVNERVDGAPPIVPAEETRRDAPPTPTANNVVVQGVLARYASAYERLDARAVKDIWPTVDERALARAFSDLDAQRIVFDVCDLTIAGTRATASCRGTASYATSVGKRNNVMQTRQWTFLLERSPERWEIQQVQVR